jgi:Autotransporter beta-domain
MDRLRIIAFGPLGLSFVVAMVALSPGHSWADSLSPVLISPSADGTAQTITRSQVGTTNNLLSSHIQSVARDIALSLGGGGGLRSEVSPSLYSSASMRADVPFAGVSEQFGMAQNINTGLSAGSAGNRLGVWLDGSGSYLKTDSSLAKNEGYGVSFFAGLDYTLADKWVFGFDAGYVRTDLDVKAINGSSIVDGGQFGPYIAYIINQHLSVDGSFSYARLSNSTTGNTSLDINRYIGAVNLNGFASASGLSLTGFVGYVSSRDDPETSSSPTVRYAAFRFGGQAGYPIGRFEPYIPLVVEVQTTDPKDGTSRTGLMVGGGGRYRFSDAIQAGFQVTTEAVRSHTTNVVGGANLKVVW